MTGGPGKPQDGPTLAGLLQDGDPEDAPDWRCQDCGACCAFSAEWPRFTVEDDEDLERIPGEFVNAGGSGMRCEGDRCSALVGEVGVGTACGVYAVRPEVCRTCMPGDPECRMARQRYGL
jgi:hypothetical protein